MSLLTNLVAYWRMEGSSVECVNGYNGTDTAITYSTANGKINQGAGFNGITSAIVVADNAAIHIQNNLSISLWFKTSTNYSGSDGGFIRKDAASGTRNLWGIGIGNGANAIMGQIYNGTTVSSIVSTGTTYNDGIWHHVVFTIDSTYHMNLYVDGVSVATQVNGVTLTTFPNGEMDIGAFPPFVGGGVRASFLNGDIDEVGIWNRVLTGTEIAQLYNGGNGLTYPFGLTQGIILSI